MATIEVPSLSRLNLTDLRRIDGITFWDTVSLPPATPRPDDISYVVRDGDRIDILAQRFYQEPSLWWVIAWANDMEVVPTDLKKGQEILIPSREYIENTLIARGRRGTRGRV